jgi:hypothetical protein
MPQPSPEPLFPARLFPKPLFPELRERLLRAGIAPRHVRRYLAELSDHLADLTAEEQTRGLPPADARSAALHRLGNTDTLAQAMIAQPRLQSLSARAPWAVFTLTPITVLAILWVISLSLLWYGWQIFLPGAPTPFATAPGPHHLYDPRNIYFQLDRALFFGAPMLIGWTTALIAARQRLSPAWPAAGLALIAALSSTARVYAVHPNIAGTKGSIHLNFLPDLSVPSLVTGILRILIVLCILMLPYAAERLRTHHPLTTNH